MEILVVDGMSVDHTRKRITEISEKYSIHTLKIIDNPDYIVPTAMNLALRRAKGEIIIRVDGHTLLSPDYITTCVETLQRTGADNVGGRMNAVGGTAFGKAVALATSTPFGIGNARFHYSDKEEWVDTVYMGAWRREVFEKIGMFDEELVRDQDDEFNYRLRAAGGKILLNPAIKSEYTVRGSPSSLWKQYFQYGYWKVRVLQKHPLQMRPRQFVPPIFVLVTILSILLSLFIHSYTPIPVCILLAYIIANLCASVLTAARSGWRSLPYLPLIYAILHISYGLGFLAGLIKFWNRWGDRVGKVPPFPGK